MMDNLAEKISVLAEQTKTASLTSWQRARALSAVEWLKEEIMRAREVQPKIGHLEVVQGYLDGKQSYTRVLIDGELVPVDVVTITAFEPGVGGVTSTTGDQS